MSDVKWRLLQKLRESHRFVDESRTILPRAPQTDSLPLSCQQEGLWISHRLNPEEIAYNNPKAVLLRGQLRREALHRAVNAVIARHETLRTTYSLQNEQPVQTIHPPADIDVPLVALDGPDSDWRREALELARTPYHLERDTPVRARLIQLASDCHVLILVTHHIVSDQSSVSRLFGDIGMAYCREIAGLGGHGDALPVQYADYCLWQRARLARAPGAATDFWTQALTGAPAAVDFSSAGRAPAACCDSTTGDAGELQFALPKPEFRRLKTWAASQKATPFAVVLTVIAAVLRKWTGQSDLVIGVPIDRREQAELRELVGMFVEVLPIRARFEADLTLSAALEQIHETLRLAQGQVTVPHSEILARLRPAREPGRIPYGNVLVSYVEERGGATVDFGSELRVEVQEPANGQSKCDLLWTIRNRDDSWQMSLEFSRTRIGVRLAQQIGDAVVALLERVGTLPDVRLSQLPCIPREDLRQMLAWNETGRDFPRDVTIATLFSRQCRVSPGSTAVVSGNVRLTYAELDARANQLAWQLRARGVDRNVCVGVYLHRSPEQLLTVLAILKAGGAYVPLDPGYPASRIAVMVEDCRPALIVGTADLLATLSDPGVPTLQIGDALGQSPHEPTQDLPRVEDGESLAYIIYTSGSTGAPKGVEIPQRGVARLVFGTDFADLGPDCRLVQLAPLSFDASTFEVWGALLCGGTLVQAPPGPVDFGELEKLLRNEEVNTAWLTAGLFNTMVDIRPEALRGLRQLITGGEALSVPHVRRARELLGNGLRLVNGYGPTESTTFACCHRIPDTIPSDCSSIPIGRPIANTQVFVVDQELQPVPLGVAGELCIAGEGLALGYRHAPELTARKFVSAPLLSDSPRRFYRTGDRVRWRDDGTLEFLGRLDQQVKLRGFRIEPGEIESVLGQHPRVRQAVVVLREDRPNDKRLVAYIVPTPGSQPPDTAELRAFLVDRLPDFMIPAALWLLDQLPVSLNGKVDRQGLPAPEKSAPQPDDAAVAPRTALEEFLSATFCELLGVATLGVHDNFFDLGGHSLLAIRLAARIEHHCRRRLPVALLFQQGSVAQIAHLLTRPDDDRAVTVVPIRPGAAGQRGLFVLPSLGGHVSVSRELIRELHPGIPVYFLQPSLSESFVERFSEFTVAASEYVAVLRTFQPSGPYALLGYCYGGMLGYEIARQLITAGDTVELLAVVDIGPGDRGQQVPLKEHLRRWGRTARNLPRWIRDDALRTSARDLWRRTRRKLRGLRRTGWARLTGSQEPEALEDVVDLSKVPTQSLSLRSTMFRSMKTYRPVPAPIRVTLFRATTRAIFDGKPDDLGWSRVALGGVEILPIPGHHTSLLKLPNLLRLTNELNQRLGRLAHPAGSEAAADRSDVASS